MSNNNKKVLLIDDEDIILEVGEKLLNFLGYECLKSKTSKDAITIFEEAIKSNNTINLVIIDILSNDKIKTEELIKKLQNLNKNIKAIISSGHLNHPLMLNYKDYGFKASIKKPYGLKELQKVLNSM